MIKKVKLINFRNFNRKEFEFVDGINFIVAPNASGKTNILESIFMLSTGKSFKARKEMEVINYNESIASIIGLTNENKLEIKITTGENGWPKKRLLVNGVARRQIDFAGNLKTTLFAPQDLNLVTDSPTIRRKFLDTVLSQTDREYRRSILSYEKGIRQRNRLLFRIREENVSRSNLLFWNQLLIKNGNYISRARQEFIEYINNFKSEASNEYKITYDDSQISEARLEQYKNEEVQSATTLVGPHRDDFIFFEKDRDLAGFGSRGEQRMATLWLKTAELNFIKLKTNIKPVLLLDDIFSELDHMHREIVMKVVNDYQTIITSADPHFVLEFKSKDVKIIEL